MHNVLNPGLIKNTPSSMGEWHPPDMHTPSGNRLMSTPESYATSVQRSMRPVAQLQHRVSVERGWKIYRCPSCQLSEEREEAQAEGRDAVGEGIRTPIGIWRHFLCALLFDSSRPNFLVLVYWKRLAPCWIANEVIFALPSKFMDLEISLFDQE